MTIMSSAIDVFGKVTGTDYIKLAQPFANELAKRIINPSTSKEDKALYRELQKIITDYQELSLKLQDSEFIRNRNLSLWLYDKLHETKISTKGKKLYKILLFHLFISTTELNCNEDFKLQFLAFFTEHFLKYLKHNLVNDKIQLKASKELDFRDLYSIAFKQLQKHDFIKELADTFERKEFVIEIFKKFEDIYND